MFGKIKCYLQKREINEIPKCIAGVQPPRGCTQAQYKMPVRQVLDIKYGELFQYVNFGFSNVGSHTFNLAQWASHLDIFNLG